MFPRRFGLGLGMQDDIRMIIFIHSASLSGGNLVDGLPRALHTGAVGGPHGGLGPAPIGTLDPRKLSFDEKCCVTLPERFVQVLDHIFMLLLS